MSMGSEHDRLVLVVVEGLMEFYQSLECKDYCLPPPAQAALEDSVAKVLHGYRALSHASAQEGLLRWHETPKHHYMQHTVLQSRVANPRWAWCYPDEDFMRIVKKIGGKCLAGTAATKVVPKLIQKWQLGILCRVARENA
eukprot:4804866-Lingulodinium_polyedra.AAC.1